MPTETFTTGQIPSGWWWRNCPLFLLDIEHRDGFAKARPGLEQAFEWFWKPNEIPAWAYELVRRLVNTNAVTEREKEELKKLPPFPDLAPPCRQTIRIIIGDMFGWHTTVLNPSGADLSSLQFSRPLPPWSFDLNADPKTRLDRLKAWLDSEMIRVMGTLTVRRDGKKSYNRIQTSLLGDWWHVELLDTDLTRLQESEAAPRAAALKHAKRFKERILGAYQIPSVSHHFVWFSPEATEDFAIRRFKTAEFTKLCAAASKKHPMQIDSPAPRGNSKSSTPR